ncbi:MAG: hypothetical protein WA949_21790 [Phormidesmis sp.]
MKANAAKAKNSRVNELPLLELFTRLRQAGLPLGVNEYQLVLQALQSGFGLPDEAAIARLCRTLWVKSEEDQILFNYHFEEVMAAERAKMTALSDPEKITVTPVVGRLAINWRTLRQKAFLGLGAISVTTAAFCLWLSRPKCPYFTSRPPGWLGIDLIDLDEEYRYNIKVCQGSPESIPTIEAVLKPPQLTFEVTGDRTALLSGAFDGEDTQYIRIDLWDFQGTMPLPLKSDSPSVFSHYGDTHDIQLSPNSQHFITRTSNGDARLWDVDGELIVDLDSPIDSDVEFSADGQYFVAFNINNNAAQIYNLIGEQVTNFNDSNIQKISLNPNKQSLIIQSNDGSVHLRDFQGGQLAKFNGQAASTVELSPSGQHLAIITKQGTGSLYDLSGDLISTFGSSRSIQALQFSPDERHIVVQSEDERIRLWDVEDNSLESIGSSDTANVRFSPDGRIILTHDDNELAPAQAELDTVRLWNLAGEQLADFGALKSIREIEFSPKGQVVMINFGDDTAQLRNLQGELLYDFDGADDISNLYYSPDDRRIVTRSTDSANYTAKLWNPTEGSLIATFQDIGEIREVVFSPDGQHVVTRSGKNDDEEKLWDASQGDLIDNFTDIQQTRRVSFSSNGQSLATLSPTYQVKLQVSGYTSGEDSFIETDPQSFRLISSSNVEAFGSWASTFAAVVFFVFLGLFLILPFGYFIVRGVARFRAKPLEFPSVDDLPDNASTTSSTLSQEIEDELQVAQAIHQGVRGDADFPLQAFTESNEYFPITSRQMKQSWRYLRQLVREGPATELDVEATITQMGREGMLLRPALRPRRINCNKLLLLIDQDGSMVPFHALSERLAKTAIYGGRLASAGTYYFHNCPTDYLYDDPHHQIAHPISAVLAGIQSKHTGVLIFSDAGAARGAFNQQRLDLTLRFLDQLQDHLRYAAWLNPMPRDRWTGTASEIAKHVPMFELSRQGLNQSIDVLRGKPIHLKA